MSVILTACRNSKQRAIERALKKKAEEKKAKREAREARMMAYQECSAPQVHTVSPDVTSWSFILDDAQYHVQFRMYTGEVFCNGVQIMDVMETFSEHGLSCSYSFTMSSHKAMITTKDGMKNSLTIDGELVAN